MRWVLGIVGLLAGNAIAMAVLVITASDGGSRVIPAYYDRAARFDDEVTAARRSRELGWRADVAAVRGEVAVEIRDRDDGPLDGARVRVTGYARANGRSTLALELTPVAPGRYRASGPIGAGWHDLEVVVDHAGQRFVRRAAVEVR